MLVCWILRWAATGRKATVEATANPDKHLDAIVEKDDKDAACNDGQEKREQHCKQPSRDCRLQSLRGKLAGKLLELGEVAGLRLMSAREAAQIRQLPTRTPPIRLEIGVMIQGDLRSQHNTQLEE